jgi:hypothetical protein
MTKEDVLNKWLVIGTESKIDHTEVQVEERLGLPVRPRQGEKGIGRLSAAFLAPISILITKKIKNKFTVAIVDWRLFENHFLDLEDIILPVEEFSNSKEFFDVLPAMVETLSENLTGVDGPVQRKKRLSDGWKNFSEYEKEKGTGKNTAESIRKSYKNEIISQRHLNEWPCFMNLVDHGTALYIIELNYELGLWVEDENADTDEAVKVRNRLRETLTGFIDPYSKNRFDFRYEVIVKKGDSHKKIIRSRFKTYCVSC